MEIKDHNTYLRYATFSDIDFIEECVINSASVNGIKFNSDDTVGLDDHDKFEFYCDYLNNYSDYSQIFIVNRQGRDVAIIAPRINYFRNITESIIFISPNACRMAAITAMKATLIWNYLFRKLNSWLTHAVLACWHPLILMGIQSVHKDNQVIVLSDNLHYVFCSYTASSMDSLEQVLLNYDVVKFREFDYLFKANL